MMPGGPRYGGIPLAHGTGDLLGWGEDRASDSIGEENDATMTIEELKVQIESDRTRLDDIGRHL